MNTGQVKPNQSANLEELLMEDLVPDEVLGSLSREPMAIGELDERKSQQVFQLDEQRAGYVSSLWRELNLVQKKDLHKINLLIEILNIKPLLYYRERLRPKNFNEIIKGMKVKAYETFTPLMLAKEVVRQLNIIILGQLKITIEQHHSEDRDEPDRPDFLTKYISEGRVGYISMSNKLQLSTATVVTSQRSLLISIDEQLFEKHLLKLEMSEQNQLLEFFRGYFFLKHLSTQRLRNIINSMGNFNYHRGEILLHQNEVSKNAILVYAGTLIVEELIRDSSNRKRFIRVSEISAQQAYGFETLYKSYPQQRLSVQSQIASVYMLNLKKLFSEAPELKAMIKSQSLNSKIKFRQDNLNKQLFIERLKEEFQPEASITHQEPSIPSLSLPMLIDPGTLQVESGFVRNESVPIRIRTKFDNLFKKSERISTRLTCGLCKDNLVHLKEEVLVRGNKLSALRRQVRQMEMEQDGVDLIFKRTNLNETRLLGLIRPKN